MDESTTYPIISISWYHHLVTISKKVLKLLLFFLFELFFVVIFIIFYWRAGNLSPGRAGLLGERAGPRALRAGPSPRPVLF